MLPHRTPLLPAAVLCLFLVLSYVAAEFSSISPSASRLPDISRFLARTALEMAVSQPNACTWGMMLLTKDPLTNKALYNAFTCTGKKVNDLGDYRACKNNTVTRYLLVRAAGVRLGLCLPRDCTKDLMEPFKTPLAALLGAALGSDISSTDVEFVDVELENQELGKAKLGTMILAGVTLFLIILATIATVLDQYGKLGTEKEEGLMQCFSLSRNISGLLSGHNRVDPNLNLFNGARFVAMCWVILGHTYSLDSMSPTYNYPDFKQDLVGSYFLCFVKTASFSADMLFFISGFFSAMAFYASLTASQGRSWMRVLVSYLHRYLRLFPLMAFSVAFLIYVLPGMRDHPFHESVKGEIRNCEHNWLWTLMYASNFRDSNVCLNWTWYLMVDMQLYLLTPLVVLPFVCSRTLGLIVAIGTAGACIGGSSVVYTRYGLHMSIAKEISENYYTKYYFMPYCRAAVYLIGIILFFAYQEHKRPNEEEKYPLFRSMERAVATRPHVKYVLYCVALAIMYSMIQLIYFFDRNPSSWKQWQLTLYEIAVRPLFVLGVAMVIYPSLVGHGGILLEIVGHPAFSSLSRVSYGVCFFCVFEIYIFTGYTLCGHYANHSWMLFGCATNILLSYLASFVVTLIFETPVRQMLHVYLEPIRKPEQDDEKLKLLPEDTDKTPVINKTLG